MSKQFFSSSPPLFAGTKWKHYNEGEEVTFTSAVPSSSSSSSSPSNYSRQSVCSMSQPPLCSSSDLKNQDSGVGFVPSRPFSQQQHSLHSAAAVATATNASERPEFLRINHALSAGLNVSIFSQHMAGSAALISCIQEAHGKPKAPKGKIITTVTLDPGRVTTVSQTQLIYDWLGYYPEEVLSTLTVAQRASLFRDATSETKFRNQNIIALTRSEKSLQHAWQRCSLLIIDGVERMSTSFFTMLETAARVARGSELFFGGLQVVLVGLWDYFEHQDPRTHSLVGIDDLFFYSKLFDGGFYCCQIVLPAPMLTSAVGSVGTTQPSVLPLRFWDSMYAEPELSMTMDSEIQRWQRKEAGHPLSTFAHQTTVIFPTLQEANFYNSHALEKLGSRKRDLTVLTAHQTLSQPEFNHLPFLEFYPCKFTLALHVGKSHVIFMPGATVGDVGKVYRVLSALGDCLQLQGVNEADEQVIHLPRTKWVFQLPFSRGVQVECEQFPVFLAHAVSVSQLFHDDMQLSSWSCTVDCAKFSSSQLLAIFTHVSAPKQLLNYNGRTFFRPHHFCLYYQRSQQRSHFLYTNPVEILVAQYHCMEQERRLSDTTVVHRESVVQVLQEQHKEVVIRTTVMEDLQMDDDEEMLRQYVEPATGHNSHFGATPAIVSTEAESVDEAYLARLSAIVAENSDDDDEMQQV